MELSTLQGLRVRSVIRLTKCCLKLVGYVLVNAIPAGQVHSTDTTHDPDSFAEGGEKNIGGQTTQILWH